MVQAVSLLPFSAAMLSVALAVMSAARPMRGNPAIRWFLLMNVTSCLWTGAYFVDLNWSRFSDLALAPYGSWEHALAWVMAFGTTGTAAYWLLFGAETAHSRFWASTPGVALAHLPMAYTLITVVTNPSHGLFMRAGVTGVVPGPLSPPHYVATLAFVAGGAWYLTRHAASRGTRDGHRQALVLGSAVAVPLLGAIAWSLRSVLGLTLPVNPGPVLTPMLYAVLAYEIFYRGLGDIVPLASLAQIMENTDVALAYLDHEFRFVSVNSAFVRASTHHVGELVGRRFIDLFTDDERAITFEEARRTLRPVSRRVVPSLLPEAPGGPRRFWDWTLTPVLDRAEELAGFVFSLSEVTDAVREQALSRKLNELDALLHSGFVSDERIRRAVADAGDALDAESSALVVVREDDVLLMQHCEREDACWEPFRSSDFPHLALSLLSREPLCSRNVETDDRLNTYMMRALGVRSTLVVPILYGATALGALAFEWRSRTASPTAVQVGFGERFAASAALALENGRRFESERRIARTLQESMLSMPEHVPGLDFAHAYRSATVAARVGGDFYDIFELDDGRRGLLIGDVSGHGLEAAVTTSLVKNAVRSQAYEDPSPALVMSRTNEVVRRQTEPDTFATAFFAALDPDTGEFAYCSAGHPLSLIVKPDGTVTQLTDSSALLGIMTAAPYAEERAPGTGRRADHVHGRADRSSSRRGHVRRGTARAAPPDGRRRGPGLDRGRGIRQRDGFRARRTHRRSGGTGRAAGAACRSDTPAPSLLSPTAGCLPGGSSGTSHRSSRRASPR